MVCNEYMSAQYYEYQQWLYDNYTYRGVVTNMTFEKWVKMQSKKENKDSERYENSFFNRVQTAD